MHPEMKSNEIHMSPQNMSTYRILAQNIPISKIISAIKDQIATRYGPL